MEQVKDILAGLTVFGIIGFIIWICVLTKGLPLILLLIFCVLKLAQIVGKKVLDIK